MGISEASVSLMVRARVAVAPLEGPNAGWVVEVLEGAFLRHGPPKHLISDREGIFTGEAFAEVTERLTWTLKREWLAPVALIRGLDHLEQLLADFEQYYNEHRCHQRLGGATPAVIYQGHIWRKPPRSAKPLPGPIRLPESMRCARCLRSASRGGTMRPRYAQEGRCRQ